MLVVQYIYIYIHIYIYLYVYFYRRVQVFRLLGCFVNLSRLPGLSPDCAEAIVTAMERHPAYPELVVSGLAVLNNMVRVTVTEVPVQHRASMTVSLA